MKIGPYPAVTLAKAREIANAAQIKIAEGKDPRVVEAIEVPKRDGAGNIVVALEWLKDGQDGEMMTSRLKVVELGQDEDGDPITSCVVEAVANGSRQAPARMGVVSHEGREHGKSESDVVRGSLAGPMGRLGRPRAHTNCVLDPIGGPIDRPTGFLNSNCNSAQIWVVS
jgi:hypothetical protein